MRHIAPVFVAGLLLAGSGSTFSFGPAPLGLVCAARSSPACFSSARVAMAGTSDSDDGDRFSEMVYKKRGGEDGEDSPKVPPPVVLQLQQFVNWQKSKVPRVNLNPKYQRGFTWDEARASRLIVTALCGRFIPAIVLHERLGVKSEKGGRRGPSTFDVVDGKQRLSSLLAFYHGDEAERRGLPTKASRLSKLPIDGEYEEWNGMEYKTLTDELKTQFLDFPISSITIPINMPAEQVFGIYEDINSGGDNLSAQQLRRAVFHGAYMDLIDDCRENEHFLRLRGADIRDIKDADGEMILRALALVPEPLLYKAPLKLFLNRELLTWEKKAQLLGVSADEYLAQKRRGFELTVRVGLQAFGEDAAFRRWLPDKGEWAPLQAPFWEISFAAVHKLLFQDFTEKLFIERGPALQAAMQRAFEEDAGGLATGYSKRSAAALGSLMRTLEATMYDVLSDGKRGMSQPASSRNFPPRERRVLWERQDGVCPECGIEIAESSVEDGKLVHIDHVQPFATGGETDMSNAQLLHAACNRAKGARPAAPLAADGRG